MHMTTFGINMNTRSIVSIIVMLLVFSFFFWLYTIEKISIAGILVLIITGVAFVAITHFIYKKLWGGYVHAS